MTIKMRITNPDELRDALPHSGIFEMFDCQVAIDAPGNAHEEDIERMLAIVTSVINVTASKVTYVIDKTDFSVIINEVPLQVAEGRIQ